MHFQRQIRNRDLSMTFDNIQKLSLLVHTGFLDSFLTTAYIHENAETNQQRHWDKCQSSPNDCATRIQTLTGYLHRQPQSGNDRDTKPHHNQDNANKSSLVHVMLLFV